MDAWKGYDASCQFDWRRQIRGWIRRHEKEREEFAPILPGTAGLLKTLINNLEDYKQVIGSVRGRHERFVSDGMSAMVKRLLAR